MNFLQLVISGLQRKRYVYDGGARPSLKKFRHAKARRKIARASRRANR